MSAFSTINANDVFEPTTRQKINNNFTAATNVDGSKPFTGNQSMGSNRLTNVLDPTSAQDAATKNFVENPPNTINGANGFYSKGGSTHRSYGAGNVKYVEVKHNDTDAQIVPSAGKLRLTPAGGSTIELEGQTNAGSTYPSSDNSKELGRGDLRWQLIRGVTITSGDIGFEEMFCAVCGEDFQVNDATILKVKHMLTDESRHVPIHLRCADGAIHHILKQPERTRVIV